MKNFDLEAAKRGAAVCTRDGRNARIIAFDCKGCGRKPILALIDMGDWEQSASHTERGEIIEDFKDASDLMMQRRRLSGEAGTWGVWKSYRG